LTQPKHIIEVLDFAMLSVNEVVLTPCDENLFKEPTGNDGILLDGGDATNFRKMLMKIGYITKSRPDVKLPFSILTSKMQQPRRGEWFKMVRILKYLNGTKELGLVIQPDSLRIYCSADASFATHADARSHTGVAVRVGSANAPFHIESKKQSLVAGSTAESEMIAMHSGAIEVVWSRNLLEELGFTSEEPAVIEQDNQSCITLSYKGPGRSATSRAINIKYFWVHQFLMDGTIALQYVRSEDMIADGLTKPMPRERFLLWRDVILNTDAWIID
jgi:hypothetical protein